ncbi:MAG: DNA polymerase I [Clostridia bacterium]|nr:DNA polymerase I [Clostridia bacterium]
MKKILLIDGNSIANRAFYGAGANMLRNAEGLYTGAVYGFVNIISKVIDSENPSHVSVAFDAGKHTFRHNLYAEYKAGRKGMPEELRQQMPVIKETLDLMEVNHLEIPEIEADDIIGSLAKIFADAGFAVVILTGDKDSLQLVNDTVTVLMPVTSKGNTTMNRVVPGNVPEFFYGAPAEMVVPMKALMGDSSDNIPGCPGIGPKGALALLAEFGSIDGIFRNLDRIPSEKTREKLRQGEELSRLSGELATIKQDIPQQDLLGSDGFETVKVRPKDYPGLLQLFKKLEFRKLIKSMKLEELAESSQAALAGKSSAGRPSAGEADAGADDGEMTLFDFLTDAEERDTVPRGSGWGGVSKGAYPGAAGAVGTVGATPKIAVTELADGAAAADAAKALTGMKRFYFITGRAKDGSASLDFCALPSEADSDADGTTTEVDPETAGASLKSDPETAGASPEAEIPCTPCVPETAYRIVFDSEDKRDAFVKAFAGIIEDAAVEKYYFDAKPVLGMFIKRGFTPCDPTEDLLISAYLSDSTRRTDEYAAAVRFYTGRERDDAGFMPEVVKAAQARIKKDGMEMLLYNVELPLVTVLADMECRGVRVDAEILRKEGKIYDENLAKLKKEIYDRCGTEFNINSPKQLGEVLFEKLGLPGGKKNKTRTGYKTGQEVLEEISDLHPVIPLILAYRQNAKLKSTYIDGLLAVLDPDTGRVFSTFNQTVTATGRLSSSEPNLQNIPVRHELGRTIRKAFVAGSQDRVLVDADYSQIELRLMAVLSGDEYMTDAFRRGLDIHALTAADVNGVDIDEVTYEMRAKAKAVNFGIIYGISEYGLAAEIDSSVKEARRYIAGYFRRFPRVAEFIDELKAFAKRNGYAVTPWGRRRYLPELINPKYPVRQFGERVAANMPIQGAAADIIKLAMVKVYRELRSRYPEAKLVLQVHDELLVDAPKDQQEGVKALLKECMEGVWDMGIPLPVSVASGYEWEK